jgi:hypothetical protein
MSAPDAELLRSNDFGALYARHVEAVHGWCAARERLGLPLEPADDHFVARRSSCSAPAAPVVRDEAAFLALERKLFANG